MSEQVKMVDKFFVYQPDGEGCGDFVAFNGAYGESILDEAECVKMLNRFNNTCAKQEEQINMLRDALNSLTQDYDSEEVAHHFGIGHDTAYKAVMALEITEPVEE